MMIGDAAHGRVRITGHGGEENERVSIVRQVEEGVQRSRHGANYSTTGKKNECFFENQIE
jgi:hypothetical protein